MKGLGRDVLSQHLLRWVHTHECGHCWRRMKYTIDDGQIYVLLLNSMSCCCCRTKYCSKWSIILIQWDISYALAILRWLLQLGVTKVKDFVCAFEYTEVVEGAPKAKAYVPKPKFVKHEVKLCRTCDVLHPLLFRGERWGGLHAALEGCHTAGLLERKSEGFQSLLFIFISTFLRDFGGHFSIWFSSSLITFQSHCDNNLLLMTSYILSFRTLTSRTTFQLFVFKTPCRVMACASYVRSPPSYPNLPFFQLISKHFFFDIHHFSCLCLLLSWYFSFKSLLCLHIKPFMCDGTCFSWLVMGKETWSFFSYLSFLSVQAHFFFLFNLLFLVFDDPFFSS